MIKRVTARHLLAVSLCTLLLLCAHGLPGGTESANPFNARRLYVDPNSNAANQAKEWQRSRPADAALMREIAAQPQAIWLGGWISDIHQESDRMVSRITAAGALPVFVAYNIPYRDCGSYSAGGVRDADAYRHWILDLARGINARSSVVILEPDALAGGDCLPARLKDERNGLMREAVATLSKAGVSVYIDAGHPKWQPPAAMADRLRKGGIDGAIGFSLNVSNFYATPVNVAYGNSLSGLVGGKHYVIDTSRNGAATAGKAWCNARNQALGPRPTTSTGQPLVDAYLWIKTPGQSDGECNGGPRAGAWWADYALELVKTAQVLGGTMPR